MRALVGQEHEGQGVAVRAEQALHLDGVEHPLVGAIEQQGREHGGLARRGLNRHKVRIGGRQVVIANADIAVIAAHQHERVAGLDGRVAELVGDGDQLAIDDVVVGDRGQQRT